jgi:hypothetical protein
VCVCVCVCVCVHVEESSLRGYTLHQDEAVFAVQVPYLKSGVPELGTALLTACWCM